MSMIPPKIESVSSTARQFHVLEEAVLQENASIIRQRLDVTWVPKTGHADAPILPDIFVLEKKAVHINV